MAKGKLKTIEITPEYGKYSFKQRLNRIDDHTEIIYSGSIQGAVQYGSSCELIDKDKLSELQKQGYKYVIIKAL